MLSVGYEDTHMVEPFPSGDFRFSGAVDFHSRSNAQVPHLIPGSYQAAFGFVSFVDNRKIEKPADATKGYPVVGLLSPPFEFTSSDPFSVVTVTLSRVDPVDARPILGSEVARAFTPNESSGRVYAAMFVAPSGEQSAAYYRLWHVFNSPDPFVEFSVANSDGSISIAVEGDWSQHAPSLLASVADTIAILGADAPSHSRPEPRPVRASVSSTPPAAAARVLDSKGVVSSGCGRMRTVKILTAVALGAILVAIVMQIMRRKRASRSRGRR